ncbi:MAG: ATP-binding protein [Candidatus Omnitrophica bacterium]|nr:ATP-binding protein [Candidatus Omnitrophota bacterium]
MIPRTISQTVRTVLERYHKMAFLSGPRQVGKTTLAQSYQKKFPQSFYFNWDDLRHQKMLLKDPYFFEKQNRNPAKPFLVVLDEIHKYSRWKNYLKGAFDSFKDEFLFLITGSGRLDLFKKGGDSLLGRYFSVKLFPLSVGELEESFPSLADFKSRFHEVPAPSKSRREAYEQLFEMSGFPDPFSKAEKNFYHLWHKERKSLLLREDIRNASYIREISLLEMLSHLIPERVGSPLSLNALRGDVGVAFETIRDWILLLEQFYYLFRLTPYSRKVARSLKKEAKAYLYDWVEIEEPAFRFENLCALHLWKAVHVWQSQGEGEVSLHYLRDKEKREVDFVLAHKNSPVCLIECKAAQEELSPSLVYFQKKLEIPVAVQLVHQPGICKKIKDGKLVRWVVSADRWLALLP